ncbi:hypothetical protein LHYA1_G006436 [Lachnellula hyalina]|uniref:Uncharacterized protein n=1 Tax=Lachnellula hyalina TaxID=1316788 RepID=A0A8H8QYE4_9HELO|nr:uncharacterized protein LHYA1_G006436 [Lachnellula hyalina]TVY25038.1 hypothetical protein LHYA1_G006436 [Lachnellula hyalina]
MQRTPPPKRRKVSPTTSAPGDAPPATPSRIPVSAAKNLSERRPSFASPTKASIARHNPQLLNRPSSSGRGAQSAGKNLDHVFAKALGDLQNAVEIQPEVIGGGTQSDATPQGSYVPATQRDTTPRARRLSVGGILSAKPRRMSRSPSKQPERSAPVVPGYGDLQENSNPFGKKGLRRSPVSSQVETELRDSVPSAADPFKKKGLRRSPISSQPVGSFEEAIAEPEVSTGPIEPTLSRAAKPITFNDGQNSEEQSMHPKVHAEKPIVPEKTREAEYSYPAPRRRTSQVTELARKSNFKSWMGLGDMNDVQQQREDAAVSPDESPLQPPSLADDVAQSRTPHQPEPVETRLSVEDVRESNGSSWLLPGDSVKEATQFKTPAPEESGISAAKSAQSSRHHVSEPKEPEIPAEEVNDSINHSRPESEEPEVELPGKGITQPSRSHRVEPEEIILSVKGVDHSRNPHRAETEEPELPPTPTQRGILDPVVTTPPTGIHDTPSKRARKSKSLGQKLKSSPLKPRDPPPPEPSKRPEPTQEKKKHKEKEPAAELEPEAKLQPEKPKRRKSARFLVPEDPYASKKKARDDLLKELQQLQADVALANQENERLRLHHESGKRRTTLAPNPEELIALLRRSTEQFSHPTPKPTSIFKSIGSFLPFSSRRRTQPAASSDFEKSLPSHLPIELDDPLPYLQAFSPLHYTSTIVLLPSEQTSSESSSEVSEQPILQKHSIHASHPTGLFASRLTMTVNSSTLSITDIDIPSLDASSEKELGAFVRERAAGDGSLGKDINVICWAMGRWVELAIKRAAFWCAVEIDFTAPEGREKALQRSARSKKRKRQGSAIAGGEESEQDEEDEIKKKKWTRRQLLPHMGRTSMEIVGEGVELRVEWRIGFDWTGEAENSISAGARVPKDWQKADDRKVLNTVPETFDRMVKGRGPLGAVRAIVGLLMPVS